MFKISDDPGNKSADLTTDEIEKITVSASGKSVTLDKKGTDETGFQVEQGKITLTFLAGVEADLAGKVNSQCADQHKVKVTTKPTPTVPGVVDDIVCGSDSNKVTLKFTTQTKNQGTKVVRLSHG